MNLCYIFASIAVIMTIIFCIVRTTVGGAYGIVTKALASLSFIALGLVGMNQTGATTYSLFVLLGLVCGLIGDIVLDNKVVYPDHANVYLNAGMASFGVGHLFYFVAASTLAIQIEKSGILLVIAIGFALIATFGIMMASKPMKLEFGKFFYQTLAYTAILTFMTAYSIGLAICIPNMWTFAVGITLILLSDLVLSTQYFGGKQDSKLLTWINHVIYYLGQIAIAVSLFLV